MHTLLHNDSVKSSLNLSTTNFNVILKITEVLQKYLKLHSLGVKVSNAQTIKIYSI